MGILEAFERGLEFLVMSGQMELIEQGHRASGKGVNTLTYKITNKDIRNLEAVILAQDYLLIQDAGVKASRIPFGGGSSSGGTSQYIEGLFNWAQIVKPSLSNQERRSFVFAVANTHKKEGMPTRGSFSYSKNGRRLSWIEFGMSNKIDELQRRVNVAAFIERKIERDIDEALRA